MCFILPEWNALKMNFIVSIRLHRGWTETASYRNSRYHNMNFKEKTSKYHLNHRFPNLIGQLFLKPSVGTSPDLFELLNKSDLLVANRSLEPGYIVDHFAASQNSLKPQARNHWVTPFEWKTSQSTVKAQHWCTLGPSESDKIKTRGYCRFPLNVVLLNEWTHRSPLHSAAVEKEGKYLSIIIKIP